MCDVGCIKYFVVRCNGIIGRPMYWAVRKGAAVGMRVRFCGPKRGQSWLFGRAERRKLARAAAQIVDNFWKWRHWRQNSLISLRRFSRRSPHRAPGRRARPPAPHAPLPHAPAHCGRWYRRFACTFHAPGQADPPNVCGATSCQHRKGRGMGGERSVGAAALVFVGPLSRCP